MEFNTKYNTLTPNSDILPNILKLGYRKNKTVPTITKRITLLLKICYTNKTALL